MKFYCNKCGYIGGIAKPHSLSNGGQCQYEAAKVGEVSEDKIVECVREDLLQRSQFGIKKYGTTLLDNKCDLRAKLQHAYEECLDQANYLKWAIMQLDAEKDDGK